MELTRGAGSWDLTSLSTKSNMAIERIHSEQGQTRPDYNHQMCWMEGGRSWNNDVSSTAMIWWCGRLDTLAGQWYYNYMSSYVQISHLFTSYLNTKFYLIHGDISTYHNHTIISYTVVLVANVQCQYIRVKISNFLHQLQILQMKKYFLNFLIDIFTFKKYFHNFLLFYKVLVHSHL